MTPYIAQITDGLVTAVRRATMERATARPDEYPGEWVPVPDMSQYPAPGWTYEGGVFVPPPVVEDVD